jgi:transcription initiation factor IIE alpha subunit
MTIIAHNSSHLFPLDFLQNPIDLITTKENKGLAKKLSQQGMKAEKVKDILNKFYDPEVIILELAKKATNPEWKEHIAYMKTVHTQYGNAIKNFQKILNIKNLLNPNNGVIFSGSA